MGGNVFEGATAPIKKENINETVENYLHCLKTIFPKKALLFTTENFRFVGSVGKKPVSGDIDFAIDSKLFPSEYTQDELNEWGVNRDSFQERFKILKSRARTATDDFLKRKTLLMIIANKMNHSQLVFSDEKKVGGNILFTMFPQFSNSMQLNEYVQIDWMIGDPDWLEFSYWSADYSGNVKGLHRTQLILAMFQHLKMTFNHAEGVKSKETGEVVANTPEQALQVLSNGFKTSITKEIASNYFSLIGVLDSIESETRDSILKVYFKILDSTRCDIPENIQSDWLRLKKEINLTGKFLPADSKLLREIQ